MQQHNQEIEDVDDESSTSNDVVHIFLPTDILKHNNRI
jgi:hypothetical protein